MLGQIGPRSEAGEGEGEPAHISLCLGEGICIFCGVEGLVSGSEFLFRICLYLFVCVCDRHVQVPSETRTHGAGVTGGCEVPGWRCWESNSDRLEEQEALLTTKRLPQPLLYILKACQWLFLGPRGKGEDQRGDRGLLQAFEWHEVMARQRA